MTWHILLSAAVSSSSLINGAPVAREIPESLQLSLTVAPEEPFTGSLEEHGCSSFAAQMEPWHDASDPLFLATGPTARLDSQELAAGSMAPLVTTRYAGGLSLLVLGVPLVVPLPAIRFHATGWRQTEPPC